MADVAISTARHAEKDEGIVDRRQSNIFEHSGFTIGVPIMGAG